MNKKERMYETEMSEDTESRSEESGSNYSEEELSRNFLRCEGQSGIVKFESHLSHCRTEVAKPSFANTPDTITEWIIENFQYLLCIPCRDQNGMR